jgi:uncharacterized protein (TIGR03437 family)
MRYALLGLVAFFSSPAVAQFTDMIAPGHGADLYYALQTPQPVMDAFSRLSAYGSASTAGPIYRVGSGPPTLFASMPAPVFPPNDIYHTNTAWFTSPYYLLSHPQFSRDLSVSAIVGRRICLDGLGCQSVTTTQTIVRGIGSADKTFNGTGWLSGNGRYLLTDSGSASLFGDPLVFIDLQAGQQQTFNGRVILYPNWPASAGRILADDGTAVLGGGPLDKIWIVRLGKYVGETAVSGVEPVIDAVAHTVIYTSQTPVGRKYLRAYDVAAAQDRVFVQPNGDSYAPSISADGRRVMFLSTAQWGTADPPGIPQLYAINLDGTGFQELTSDRESAGVQQYTVSDDGQIAWYASVDGRLVRLDLTGAQPPAVFRPAAVDLSGPLVPGSATILSANLKSPGKVIVYINGAPAPLFSVAPGGIVFQTPSDTPPDVPARVQVVIDAGTENESTAWATVPSVASRPWFLPVEPCGAANSCDLAGGAIHQDWSGYVTPQRPAVPGEVIHLYGTGFGSIAPACVSFAGPAATLLSLNPAPGFPGYYQLDIQLPPFFTQGPTSNRTYDQFSITCDTAVTVFAIKTKAP